LTKNWTPLLEQNFESPATVAEAVDRLILLLRGEEKLMIAMMKEDDLFDLHFSLGLAIRNAFGLHEAGSKLLASCGTPHPDDASSLIIKALWKELKAL
jgi:hypothetical protein